MKLHGFEIYHRNSSVLWMARRKSGIGTPIAVPWSKSTWLGEVEHAWRKWSDLQRAPPVFLDNQPKEHAEIGGCTKVFRH
jgi:hypothetical protein